MSGVLRVSRRSGITLADALAVLSTVSEDARWTALVYTPDRCAFAELCSGALLDHDGQALPLASVFEARVFGPPCELRWHHQAGGRGRAAVVSAQPEDMLAQGWDRCDGPFLETMDNGYLLWGRVVGPARSGWTRLFEARIGDLHVPVAPTPGADFLRLKAVEYLGEPAGDGNVRVIEEQLTGIEPAPRVKKAESPEPGAENPKQS